MSRVYLCGGMTVFGKENGVGEEKVNEFAKGECVWV